MPRYMVHISFGFVGCEINDEIEAESMEEAEEIAWNMATQQIECSVEEIKDEDK